MKPHVGAAVIVLILSGLIDRSAVTFLLEPVKTFCWTGARLEFDRIVLDVK